MNENPEGTPNPLNPTQQPVTPPAPATPTGTNKTAVPEAPSAPVASPTQTNSTAAPIESVAPVTAEQLLEQTPSTSIPVNRGTSAAEEPKPATPSATEPKPVEPKMVAPKPTPRSSAPKLVDPMMARRGRPAIPTPTSVAPASASGMVTPQGVNSSMPSGGQEQNFTDDADAIIQQLSQNTTEQPAEQVPAPKKKSKKGLIVLAVIFILLAIGCGAAAIFILNPFAKDDRVPVAVDRFLNGQISTNVGMKGNISYDNGSTEEGLSSLNINLDAEFANTANANVAKAAITADFTDGTELNFDADEITTTDGTSYVRLTGIADSLKNGSSGLQTTVLNSESLTTENCVESSDGTTNCTPSDTLVQVDEVTTTCEGAACDVVQQDTMTELGYVGVIVNAFESVDGEWIRIPQSDTPEEEGLLNNPIQCITNSLAALPTQSSQIKSAYSANPFIEYSTENLNIPKIKDNLYRISINEQKFTNFVNALDNNSFANELLACVGGQATNDGVTPSEMTEIFDGFPTVYVEIDDQYNFTRIVFNSTLKDGSTVKADLQLSYPSSVNIIEPEEYVDINVLLEAMLRDLYGITTDTTTDDNGQSATDTGNTNQ